MRNPAAVVYDTSEKCGIRLAEARMGECGKQRCEETE